MKDSDAKKLKANDWINVNVDKISFEIQRSDHENSFIKKFKVAAIIQIGMNIFPLLIIDDIKMASAPLCDFKNYKFLDSFAGNVIELPEGKYYSIDIGDMISIEPNNQPTKQIDIPTFCTGCGYKNEYGVINQPDNTFKCFSCREDPFRASF